MLADLAVDGAAREQLGLAPARGDAPVVEHDELVRERDRREPVRDHDRRPAAHHLDEPSAALDPASERRIADGYEAVMRGRTTIVITHRMDLAARADRIVVLDAARVLV